MPIFNIDGDKEPRMSTVPTPTTALTLDEINPASFDFWLRDDVEGALAKLRTERPVAWHQHPDSGKGFWSITRFDDEEAGDRPEAFARSEEHTSELQSLAYLVCRLL